jgi:hypothetical protein
MRCIDDGEGMRSEPEIAGDAAVLEISAEDQRALVAAILDPLPLTPAMERAIERHRRLIAAER